MIIPFAILRWILGAVLLSAAALKCYQLVDGRPPGDGLLHARGFMILVVSVELGMAAWLLVGWGPTALWRATIAVFGALGGAALAKGLAGEASCGCFGAWTVSPWAAAGVDAAALAALCTTRFPMLHPSACVQPKRRPAMVALGAVALGAVALLPALWALSGPAPARLKDDGHIAGTGQRVVLEPERWIGRHFPLRDYIEIPADLGSARWVVVLIDADCRLCRRAAAQYRSIAADLALVPGAPRLALVTLAGDSDEGTVVDDAPALGRLSDRVEWRVAVPVELTLHEGVVTRVRTQVIPRLEDFTSL